MTRKTIAFATSEITPFAKTGGLADVSAALPAWLHRVGHDVRVFLPLYSGVEADPADLTPVPEVQDVPVDLGGATIRFSLFRTTLRGSGLPVHFVHCPALYDRDALYTEDPDEAIRFALLNRAVLESCQRMQWFPDILHCNDWQTGLLPLLLRTLYAWDAKFRGTRTVLTIHNLGYQGLFPAASVDAIGLGPVREYLDGDELHNGRVGFLRTGLTHVDAITTVSPTYAREIRTPIHGAGMHHLLQRRKDRIVGILNGVDTDVWNPSTDRQLAHRYSAKSMWRKAKNKEHLLQELGLSYDPRVPVVGMVTRLAYQKGIDLLEGVLPEALRDLDFSLVVLASGEERYERFFLALQHRYPKRVCFYRGYEPRLAHWIEAGSDLFLMPSRYEPCGLNQMYSLLYGTVPIVRNTGGLADTVELYDPITDEGNGIVFDHATTDGVRWALRAALDLYRDEALWSRLRVRGMAEDFSW
ncbi:glycogen synthase, partial [bacterium]|nr:glycogen synthase [bacterium]